MSMNAKSLWTPKLAKFSDDDSALGDIAAILIIFCRKMAKRCTVLNAHVLVTQVVLFEAVDVRYFGI